LHIHCICTQVPFSLIANRKLNVIPVNSKAIEELVKEKTTWKFINMETTGHAGKRLIN